MKRIVTFIALIFFSSGFHLSAEEVSPYKTLANVGNSLFARIAQNQQELIKFPNLMETIVKEELMPHVDYKYTALKILGKHVENTTKEQRQAFVEAMRQYLIKTYANALKQYRNQHVSYEADKPTRGQRIVGVKAQIIELNKPTIDIIFQMRQDKKTKQWKAYDMIVEGISLLTTKQAEIGSKISKIGVEQVSLELAYLEK